MARVLVVDDNDEVAAYLRDMLESGGHESERCATSIGAVQSMLRGQFDLILMDLLLQGGLNGAVTTLALRGIGFNGPVVVITGGLMPLDPDVVAACGFAARLLKPALPKDVLPLIDRLLGSNPARPRVLVVEDDAAFAATLNKVLVSAGYDVDVTPTGAQAIAAFVDRAYALALVDLTLPDMSGVEITTRVGGGVPMVAVTGYVGDHDMSRFAEVIEKPASLSTILAVATKYAPIEREGQ